MIDPQLERNYKDCAELLELWKKFHERMIAAGKGQAPSPESEIEFMGLKSRVAMIHDSFMKALTADQNIGQSMLSIVSRAITLQHLTRMSVAELKKMEIEWHQSFLLLQETIGNLEEKRADLAEISETAYKADRAKTAMKQRFDRIFKSNTFMGMAIFAVLLFGTVGVHVLGIFEWTQLRNYSITRTPFYYVYDIGLRFLFPKMPYYRLDWVGVDAPETEIRAFLPGSYWTFNKENDGGNYTADDVNIERELGNIGLPQSTFDQIRANNDSGEIWCFNSQDFICIAMFLMDSTDQAERLANEIRNKVVNTPAARIWGANNRANILEVFYFSPVNNADTSHDAFSEFVQRGPDLIK